MFLKSVVFVVGLTVIATALLELRHQRVEIMHDMAVMHRQVDRMRHSMWDTQAQMTEHLQPGRLEGAVEKMKLALEPVGPTQSDYPGQQRHFAQGVDGPTDRGPQR